MNLKEKNNMWPFIKNIPKCEHEYEVIHNEDFYSQYQIDRHSIFDCFSELKIKFQDEFLKILKSKNIDKEEIIKLIRDDLEPAYQERLKKELEKRKAIGHVVVQRCKKCGKIYKEVINYNI